jgi:small subunit ribosomal protein S18
MGQQQAHAPQGQDCSRDPAPGRAPCWAHIDIPSCAVYFSFLISPLHRAPIRCARQEQFAIGKFRSTRREAVAKLKLEEIDYKRLDVLAKFITPSGKIEAARRTGATRKQQGRVARAIKRARYLALMPYSIDDAR